MAHYQRAGDVPAKRHTQHRDSGGRLYYEELMGEEGFSSDSSLLYHRGIPSAMVDARSWELPDQTLTPNAPLMPRHLKLHDLFAGEEHKATDPVTGRRLVLGNAALPHRAASLEETDCSAPKKAHPKSSTRLIRSLRSPSAPSRPSHSPKRGRRSAGRPRPAQGPRWASRERPARTSTRPPCATEAACRR